MVSLNKFEGFILNISLQTIMQFTWCVYIKNNMQDFFAKNLQYSPLLIL